MKIRRFAKHFLAFTFVFVLSAVMSSQASAVLIVDFQQGIIRPGGQQQIDVFLSSDLPAGQTEGIFIYDLSFRVNESSVTGDSSVVFIDPLDETFIEDSNYVFFGNSLNADNPPSDVFDVQAAGEIVLANDETSTGLNVRVGSTPVLLSRLMLQHNLGSETPERVNQDVYEITLARDPLFDIAFENENGDPVNFGFRTRGTIVVEAIAVPEPGTFGFATIACMGLAASRRRRR